MRSSPARRRCLGLARRRGHADKLPSIAQRRRHNAPERRRQLADAAIELFGTGGARGLSHPKVDVHARVPAGTTSFYFRTRQALLLAVAERLTELDLQDLSRLTELATDGSGQFTGTAGLAQLVMYSGDEPFLTRTKARYELALHASRDADLMAVLQSSVDTFYRLAHDVVTRWHAENGAPPPDLVDEQSRAALALINGVMLSFVTGRPIVDSAAELEHLLDGLIGGLTANPNQPRRRTGEPGHEVLGDPAGRVDEDEIGGGGVESRNL